MFPNVVAFANSISELKGRVKELLGGGGGGEVGIPADVQRSVRALVLPGNTTYAAAAWYLVAGPGCPRDTMGRLSAGGWDGFVYYVTKCLHAGGGVVDVARKGKWCSAVAVLAPVGMDMPSQCNGVALEK